MLAVHKKTPQNNHEPGKGNVLPLTQKNTRLAGKVGGGIHWVNGTQRATKQQEENLGDKTFLWNDSIKNALVGKM